MTADNKDPGPEGEEEWARRLRSEDLDWKYFIRMRQESMWGKRALRCQPDRDPEPVRQFSVYRRLVPSGGMVAKLWSKDSRLQSTGVAYRFPSTRFWKTVALKCIWSMRGEELPGQETRRRARRDVKKKVSPRLDAEKIFVSRSSPLPVSVPPDSLVRFVVACLPFPGLSLASGR